MLWASVRNFFYYGLQDRCKINNTFGIYNNMKLFYFYICSNNFIFVWISNIYMKISQQTPRQALEK